MYLDLLTCYFCFFFFSFFFFSFYILIYSILPWIWTFNSGVPTRSFGVRLSNLTSNDSVTTVVITFYIGQDITKHIDLMNLKCPLSSVVNMFCYLFRKQLASSLLPQVLHVSNFLLHARQKICFFIKLGELLFSFSLFSF